MPYTSDRVVIDSALAFCWSLVGVAVLRLGLDSETSRDFGEVIKNNRSRYLAQ